MLADDVHVDTIPKNNDVPKALGAKRGAPGSESTPTTPLTDTDDITSAGILHEGFLGKRHTRGFTLFPNRWQMRYVIADGTRKLLRYMLAEDSTQCRGSIPFSDIVRVGRTRGTSGGTQFEIEMSISAVGINAGRIFYFRAADPREADVWIATLFNASPALQSVSTSDDISTTDVVELESPKVHAVWSVKGNKPKMLELKSLTTNERAATAAGLRPPTGGVNSGVFSKSVLTGANGNHRTRRAHRRRNQEKDGGGDSGVDIGELGHDGLCCSGGCFHWSHMFSRMKNK